MGAVSKTGWDEKRRTGTGARVTWLYRALIGLLLLATTLALSSPSIAGLALTEDARKETERKAVLQSLYDQLAALPKISAQESAAGKRRALVIGNNDYVNIDPLTKAEGDAGTISAALTTLGFETTMLEDVDRDRFDDALDAFYTSLHEGDVAVFYFSGHGLAHEGVNYLLPVDIPMLEPDDGRKLRREAVDAAEVAAEIRNRGVELALIVLDACRDAPFEREGTKGAMRLGGLAQMEPQRGVFVIYSAGVGQQALDRLGPADTDPNSVFTRKFSPILTTPGLPLVDIAKRTQIEVRSLAGLVNHRQEPAYYDQVVGQTYFQPPRPRLFGIAIGVDDYAGTQSLRGAVNDADRVGRALEALGAEKVVRLMNGDARVSFIDYVWHDMIADAAPGDTIVLSYAGSSASFPAIEDRKEADGNDEALLLSGFDYGEYGKTGLVHPDTLLMDDDLTRWMELAAKRNINVVLLVDGCYGGGLLDRSFGNVSFVGASAEDEVVREYEVAGEIHGLASVAFAMGIEGLADLNRDGFVTQRELYVHVAAEVFKIAGLKQNPQFLPELDGKASDLPLFKLPADIGERVSSLSAKRWQRPQALDLWKAAQPLQPDQKRGSDPILLPETR